MKKLPILIGIVCLTQLTLAQNTRFGLRGGLNIANQKVTVSVLGQKASQSGDAIPSFHIGGMGEIQLSDIFFIQPSLLLSGKGMNYSTKMTREMMSMPRSDLSILNYRSTWW